MYVCYSDAKRVVVILGRVRSVEFIAEVDCRLQGLGEKGLNGEAVLG